MKKCKINLEKELARGVDFASNESHFPRRRGKGNKASAPEERDSRIGCGGPPDGIGSAEIYSPRDQREAPENKQGNVERATKACIDAITTIATPTIGQRPGFLKIQEAWRTVERAHACGEYYAVLCGQMMVEERAEMSFCQSDNNSPWQGQSKEKSEKFLAVLAEALPEISQRTAYRWMQAAEHVIRILGQRKELPHDWRDGNNYYPTTHMVPSGGRHGERRLISEVMMDEDGGKLEGVDLHGLDSLRDIVRRVIAEYGLYKLYIAKIGKDTGGFRSENRKAYGVFTGRALRKVTSFLTVKATLPAADPLQSRVGRKQGCTITPVRRVRYARQLPDEEQEKIKRETVHAIDSWPEWYVRFMKTICEARLKLEPGKSLLDRERGSGHYVFYDP